MNNITKDYSMKIANSAPPNKYGTYPFSLDSIKSLPHAPIVPIAVGDLAQAGEADAKPTSIGRRIRHARKAHPPQGGRFGLVLPQTFVFCVIPSHPTIFQAFPTS